MKADNTVSRWDRIKMFLRDCITANTDCLANLKEELCTLPEQIAKWEAERARLESQTGLDLLRAVVAEQGEKPGAWVRFRSAIFSTSAPSHPQMGPWQYGRIIGDTPLVEIAMPTEPTEEATQPTTEPPEDNDPVERAFWRFCMLIDKTQRAARVKAGYLEGPYPQRDAFKIAVRSTVLGLTVPTHIADASKKELADAAEKKESGSLKVGDRVEVPEGVWDLVHEGAIPPGQYEVTRNWEDGIIRIQRGSVRYLVRDSDLAPVKLNALKNQVQALAEKL